MEVKNAQCTIKGIFGLILCVTSIAGLGPLSVESVKDGWRLTVSKFVDIYGKFLVLFMCVLAVLAVFTTYELNPKPFHLQTTSDRILAVLSLIMALPAGLVASWTGMKRMRHLISYLLELEKVNSVLKQYCQQATHDSRMSLCTVCLLAFGIFTVFADYGVFVKHVIYHNYEVPRQCMYIFYFMLVEYIQLISIQFSFTASSILSSFSFLNNFLRSLIKNSSSASIIDNTRKGLAETIHDIRRQYFALSDLIYSLNESHGLLLVQLLMVYLINLTITPYKILNLILKAAAIEYDKVAVQFLGLILHISNLVIVIEPCQRTHNEMHKTKILISKLMRSQFQSKDAVSSELQSFYTSLMSQDITYTPLSMFTIDRTLIMPNYQLNMELPPLQECTVKGTLAFVLRLSQLLGVASLKFERYGRGWKICTSKTARIYGITVLVLICAPILLLRLLQLLNYVKITTVNYNNVLAFGVAIIFSSLLCSEIFFKLYRMEHIIACLSEVEKNNTELSQYAVHKSNETLQCVVTIWSILDGLICIAADSTILLVSKIVVNPNVRFQHGMHLMHLAFAVVKVLHLQISLIITTVLSSFTHLNECLKNLLQQIRKKSSQAKVLAPSPKYTLNADIPPKSINILIDSLGSLRDQAATKYENTNDVILNRLGYIYCNLYDVVQQIDNSHGLFIVLLITSHFINLAFTLYNFIYFLMKMEPYLTIISFLWVVNYLSDMVILIEPSHQTCLQVRHTKHLISQLMLSTPPESHAFKSELNLFYKNLLFNEVSYKPLKMFELNRTIITVITGSIITYLVVILQL